MQVVEGESGQQPRGEEFVDIVRVEVIDWLAFVSISRPRTRALCCGATTVAMEVSLPVTFEVEKGCAMLNSCHGHSRCRIAVTSDVQVQLSSGSLILWSWGLLFGGCAAPSCA
jgi:hypothetical protein